MDHKAGPRRWEAWQVLAALLVVVVVIGVPVVSSLNRKPLPPDEYFPAVLLGNPLRLQTGAGERIFLLSEQKMRHWYWYSRGRTPFGSRQVSDDAWQVNLWALDATDGRVLWRRRFDGNGTDSMGRHSELLTAEGDTLRVVLREPLRVSAIDGTTLAAPAGERLPLAGTEVYDAYGTVARGSFDAKGGVWLGLLTGPELGKLSDRKATPENLAYAPVDGEARLHRAQVKRVSAAPPDWPAGLGGNWGQRNAYSRYALLEAAPVLRQAGLLVAEAQGPAIRLPDPDGVLLLHRPDGDAKGAMKLARIEAQDGRVAWETDLPQRRLLHVLPGPRTLVLSGHGPRPDTPAPDGEAPAPAHWFSFIDLDSGQRHDFELGRASQAPPDPGPEP